MEFKLKKDIDIREPSFYGEWVYYSDEEEKQEAYEYFRLWKKFLLRKMMDFRQEGEDQIVDRVNTPNFLGEGTGVNTLGIKIKMVRNETE